MNQFELITEEDRRLSTMAINKFENYKQCGLIITETGEI